MICWPIFAEQFINSLQLLEKGVGVMFQTTGLNSPKIIHSKEIADVLLHFFNDDISFFLNISRI